MEEKKTYGGVKSSEMGSFGSEKDNRMELAL